MYNFLPPVSDGSAKAFLDGYAFGKSPARQYGLVTLDAGITQCIAALETITQHSEGHDAITNGARSDDPAEVARDLQIREQLADRWQQWWKAHQPEFVSEQEMASLKAARVDVVDPIGVAKFGPVFPTGAQVRLGPIREATLQATGTWDAKAYIDFDAGRVYAHNEGWHDVAPEQASDWIGDAGVDAYARLTHPTDRAATSKMCMLQGRGMTAWRIPNARFDDIDSEVQANGPLDMGAWGATDSLVARDVTTDTPQYGEYPVTFLFATREGGRGIMQIVGPVAEGDAMRLRYRMFEGMPVKEAPLAAALNSVDSIDRGFSFGQVHELSLGAPASPDDSALQLQTGKTRPQLVATDDVTFTESKREWLQNWGGDVMTLTWANHQVCGLGGDHMLAMEVSPDAWDNLPAGQLTTYLGRRDPAPGDSARTFLIPDPAHNMPATWIVETREGELGLVQITELSNDHLAMRYKLIGGE
jgi:hypothetical protein